MKLRLRQPRRPLFREAWWRWYFAGVLLTALVPLFLLSLVEDENAAFNPRSALSRAFHGNGETRSDAFALSEHQRPPTPMRNHTIHNTEQERSWTGILKAVEVAEAAILDFFHGESRALDDGVPFGGALKSSSMLVDQLVNRILQCRDSNRKQRTKDSNACLLRIVFVGSAQTSGRDNFFNQSFPFWVQKRLTLLAQSAGLVVKVDNHAMDSDLSREGPQTNHMCVANLVGQDVDIIGWDFDGNMQAKPAAQVEAFLRWASALQPALILMNRDGPHMRSRRGNQRVVVNISPGHNAIVYEDDVDNPPEPRSEPYRNSSKWKQRWSNQRNSFWVKLIDKYSAVTDLVAIDPVGATWHLDHLEAFSNQAFDAEKALPLFDCGSPGHDPPCNQVPKFIYNHLAQANMSNASLPLDDTGGNLCGVTFGCRHNWYGGTRSHALRGALNAIAIVRAFRLAAETLMNENLPKRNEARRREAKDRLRTLSLLPTPEFCNSEFCSKSPTCITSYVPNLGIELGSSLVVDTRMPLMGASHYANRAPVQVNDLERRFAPLGYIDRKYAYRLAMEKNENRKKKNNEEIDVHATSVAFTATGDGPLVLCEPPCFIDECSKKRKMPLLDFVTLQLDGNATLSKSKRNPSAVEVGGKFCTVIAKSISKGDHMLRISTNVTSPDHVMFSHLISFA